MSCSPVLKWRPTHCARGRGLGTVGRMHLDVLTLGSPALGRRAQEVSNVDGRYQELVSSMFEVLYRSGGLGLAATQVGVMERVFVYDLGGAPRVLFNPVIVETSGEWSFVEGCLSMPGLFVDLVRPRSVLLSAVSADGEKVNVEATDLLARLYQHEVDHLDGVLLIDRLSSSEKSRVLDEYARTPHWV